MIRPRFGRTTRGAITALALLLAGAPGFGFASETLRVAVPQQGNWETSVSDWGSRQGFFREQGLDLFFTYPEGGATTEQAVISGSVDLAVATGTLGIISAYVKGAPIRIIAAEMTG